MSANLLNGIRFKDGIFVINANKYEEMYGINKIYLNCSGRPKRCVSVDCKSNGPVAANENENE